MDESTYGFSKPDAQQLVDGLGSSQSAFDEAQGRQTFKLRHALTPAGGIAASSGLQMSSATCTKMTVDSSGLRATTTDNITIYNPSASAIAGSTRIAYLLDEGGNWVAVVESCS